MKRSVPPLALLPFCVLSLACGGSDDPAGPDGETTSFTATATLAASNVVGAEIDSPGTGTATFAWDGTRLSFVVDVENMNQIIAAHVHGPATADQNADILLDLFVPAAATGAVNGRLTSGAAVTNSHLLVSGSLSSLLDLMRQGRVFVLVHTVQHPDGEIRGQIVREQP